MLDIKGVELGGTVKETLVILFEKAEWLKNAKCLQCKVIEESKLHMEK